MLLIFSTNVQAIVENGGVQNFDFSVANPLENDEANELELYLREFLGSETTKKLSEKLS